MFFLTFTLPLIGRAQGVYWSFNNDNHVQDFGHGSLGFSTLSLGAIAEGWGSGTLIGAVDSTPAGDAKDLVYLVNALVITDVDLSHLDFTGQTGVTLSFAMRSDELFEAGEYLSVSYDIGSGFTGAQTLTNPDTDWSLRTVTFGGALDNQSDVKIRIESGVALDIGKILEFDNVYVPQAVPEPALALPVILSGFLFLLFFRRHSVRD